MRSVGTVTKGRRPIVAMVGMGIFLFVAGFMVTVSCLGDAAEGTDDGNLSSSSSTSTPDAFLLIGLSLSLAGVVSATAGPAAFFIHKKRSV
jgi:hypothetical protein